MIQSKDTQSHGYQSYTGIPQLRQAFTTWYEQYFGVSLKPESEILPLMGSKEGIMHISLAFLNPGDKVLVPDPGYPAYNAVANIVGAEVIKYNLTEENNWLPDFDELESLAKEDVKILWMNYPNMPTGTKATKAMFEELIHFAVKHKILVVNDNPYSFILNEEPLSILSVPGAKDVVIELNSLSKSHNMAGWRIGCVAGDADYLKCILAIKSNMDSGMFKPMQLAAVKALGKDKNWYKSINAEYAKRQVLAMEIFDKLKVKYDKAQSGMFVWGKIPPTFENSYAFSDHFLDSKSVFFTPGAIFGKNGEQYVRISLCSTREVFQEVIHRLE
jgi:aspartate/methionine/tyrosine aminotransferase